MPARQQPTHQQTRLDHEPPQEPRQHPQDAAKTDVKVKKKKTFICRIGTYPRNEEFLRKVKYFQGFNAFSYARLSPPLVTHLPADSDEMKRNRKTPIHQINQTKQIKQKTWINRGKKKIIKKNRKRSTMGRAYWAPTELVLVLWEGGERNRFI